MAIASNQSLGILFLTVATISTLCSGAALYTIWRFGKWTTATQLLLALHFTLLFEEVTTIPFAYSSNTNLCKAFGFFHMYSGLANVVTTGLLTLHYCNFILFSNPTITTIIVKYKALLIFVFPLITLLPFSNDSYGRSNSNWCTLPSDNRTSNDWAIAVFYSWAWFILLVSFGLICYVIHKARMLDDMLSRRVFSAIGVYVFFTILCWLPRTIPRFMKLFITFQTTDIEYFWTTFPLYFTGIIYTIILFWDRAVLKVEDHTISTDGVPGVGEDINFTWDTFDDLVMDNRLTATITTMSMNPMQRQSSARSDTLSKA